jgi:hypothetical protein
MTKKRVSQKEARRLHALRIRLTRARRRIKDNLAQCDDKALVAELRKATKAAVDALPASRPMVEQAVIELSAPTMVTLPEGWEG